MLIHKRKVILGKQKFIFFREGDYHGKEIFQADGLKNKLIFFRWFPEHFDTSLVLPGCMCFSKTTAGFSNSAAQELLTRHGAGLFGAPGAPGK